MSVESKYLPDGIGVTRLKSLPTSYKAGFLGLVFLIVLPLGLREVQMFPMIGVIFLMIFAMTWDIASGYTGDLNLGHTAFIGLGGYTTALLNIDYGISPLIGIPMGTVVAGLGGLLIGFPALRLRGPYLALITLIIPVIMVQMTILFRDTLRGLQGFGLPPVFLVGTLDDALITVENSTVATIANYYIALFAMLIVLAILLSISRSETGDILKAIRVSEEAVASVGVNPAKFRIFAFTISAASAGFAGALFVHTPVGHPAPGEILDLELSLMVVIIAVLGGMGTIVGSVVGAFLFGTLEILAGSFGLTIPLVGKTLGDLMPIPLMLIGIVVVVLYPRGIVPPISRWLNERGNANKESRRDRESNIPLMLTKDKFEQGLNNIRGYKKEDEK